jgi:septal ring factor EnvC (AmiA/AmiB activator)
MSQTIISPKRLPRKIALLTGVAMVALGASSFAAPAIADDAAILERLDRMQKMLEAQQRQIEAQRAEIASLKEAKATTSTAPATATGQVQNQQAQIDALKSELHAY